MRVRAGQLLMSRRRFLSSGLIACGCSICGGLSAPIAARASAASLTSIKGRGYELWFVGAQRETIANGMLSAILDLKTLVGEPDLYGIGPIEHLRGEVTIINGRSALATVRPDRTVEVNESFDAGVPFFVWSKVPVWRPMSVPQEVRSLHDLEQFIPKAAAG